VTNIFKGLELVDRVPKELWTEVHNNVQEVVIKTIPQKRNARRWSCRKSETKKIIKPYRKQRTYTNFDIHYLVMSMCTIVSWVVGKECLL